MISSIKLIAVVLLLNILSQKTNAITFEEDTTLTGAQSKAFIKFKNRVLPQLQLDYQKEDLFLLRWLRAKNFDVKRAEDFLISQLKWQKENNWENVHDENWGSYAKDYTFTVGGTDRDGRPLIAFELGDWDIRRAILAGEGEKLIRWVFKMWDEGRLAVQELQAQDKNVTRWTMLFDLKNINAVTNVNVASLPFYLGASLGYDTHFPHLGDNIYLINTPGLFQSVISLVKPGLAPATRDALHVYGKNEAEWGPILNAAIDPSQLPPRYGGTKLSTD